MAYERLTTHGGEQSLAPLVDKTELLSKKDGHVVATSKIQVPKNEFGIPMPQELLRDVLASLAIQHEWTGHADVHHIAWPESRYKGINTRTQSHAGGLYRGAAALKVRMPRQLHNYIHAVTEPPETPDIDTMRQWTLEQRQVDRLYDTVSRESMSDIRMPEEQREKYRFSSFHSKLDHMDDGYLGLMPEREYLAALTIEEARRALYALARVRRIANSRSSQTRFFGAPFISQKVAA